MRTNETLPAGQLITVHRSLPSTLSLYKEVCGRYDEERMTRYAIKQGVLVVLACAALFVSSISACACSHHSERAKTDSCHPHQEHSDNSTQKAEELSPGSRIDSSCVCIAREPLAAPVKVEKNGAELNSPVLVPAKTSFLRLDRIVFRVSDNIETSLGYASLADRRLLPSRTSAPVEPKESKNILECIPENVFPPACCCRLVF